MDYKVKGLQVETDKKRENFADWKTLVKKFVKERKNKEDKKDA